jgi:uncharacterized membrane protein YeaQ/YmgE (transglycosylase-associated protein family)
MMVKKGDVRADHAYLLKAISIGLVGAMSGGTFFEIWPFEDRHGLLMSSFGTLHAFGVNQSEAL